MEENANPNPEVSTSLDAAAPPYHPRERVLLQAHTLTPPGVPLLAGRYVLYAPLVSLTPAEAELSTSTPAQVTRQYRVGFCYIFRSRF